MIDVGDPEYWQSLVAILYSFISFEYIGNMSLSDKYMVTKKRKLAKLYIMKKYKVFLDKSVASQFSIVKL